MTHEEPGAPGPGRETVRTKLPDTRPPAAPPKGPLAHFVDRVLLLGPVGWLIPILNAYDAAGGGLLASGLAFTSLFAILPSILLIIAVVGVLLGDANRLADVSARLATSFPPLAGFFEAALGGFAKGAITYSVVGLVALVWGSSRFYQSLDDAMAHLREHPAARSVAAGPVQAKSGKLSSADKARVDRKADRILDRY